MKKYIYNIKSIEKFYKLLNFIDFSSITLERKNEIDEIIYKSQDLFLLNTTGLLTLMTFVAEKLTTSYTNFGLQNKAEIAYFFISIIDPTLLFLEVYECANLESEIKEICFKNFHFYDKYLILLEKKYNDYFKIYLSNELWSRELIKK